ncbi:hypothetical protein SAY86_014713 [Trapa natans]|uniref:Pentatricopeptide repeat-containing protein n=1 Tax=Trapa natans TaxID=22666 RepID=A0AAN7KIG1_TRANT|nr:hypothetical protein SAY86_014713 [Trapa natans]
MPEKELPLWNAMITGCADSGREDIVFSMFSQMLRIGVDPDHYSFAGVLSSFSTGTLDKGKQVHSLVIKTGFLAYVSVINALITLYFDCSNPSEACSVFDEAGACDEITFNVMIDGLMDLNRSEEALTILGKMQEARLRPTELTFVSLMCSDNLTTSAQQLHSQAIKMGLQCSTIVSNAAISMYLSYGDLQAAQMIFDRLVEKDLVSWNTLISCYAHGKLSQSAILAFSEMRKLGFKADEYTFGSLLASFDLVELVEMVQGLLIKNGLIQKLEVCNALVSSYSRLGSTNQAYDIFLEMPQRNLITWNALISGLLLNGLLFKGLQSFAQLLVSGLRPNVYTFTIALTTCANIGSLKHGKQIHAYTLRNSFFLSSSLGNALIAMYSKCGALDHSLKVFADMTERDTISWNSMISALAQHGKGKEAVEIFEAMRNETSCKPDEATFTALISGCSRSGLVGEGIEIFNIMVNHYSIVPQDDHISSLLDLVGRAGYLDESERLIGSNHLRGHSGSLWNLFSACAAQGNLRLGRIVAELLLGSEKDDPSVYVLLANIYAAAGQWKEADDVRIQLRRNGAMKQPGCSWIGS